MVRPVGFSPLAPLPITRRRATGSLLPPRSQTLTLSLPSLPGLSLGTAAPRCPRGYPCRPSRSRTRECPPAHSLRAAPSLPSLPVPCPTTLFQFSRPLHLVSSPPTLTRGHPHAPNPETPLPLCTNLLAPPLLSQRAVRLSEGLLIQTSSHPCPPALPRWWIPSLESPLGCRLSAEALASGPIP